MMVHFLTGGDFFSGKFSRIIMWVQNISRNFSREILPKFRETRFFSMMGTAVLC